MNTPERIQLLDRVLIELDKSETGLVPELLDGYQKYPAVGSETDKKYRILENELIKLGVADKIGGGDNSTFSGYLKLKITTKGLDLIMRESSVSELY